MDQDDLNTNNSNPQTTPASGSGGLADLPPLPNLDEAEDDTFAPPPAPPTTTTPVTDDVPIPPPTTDVKPETDMPVPPLPSEPDGDSPKKDKMKSDGGDDLKKPKKKSRIGAVVGGVIALLLLVGVPMVALNIDKFRGDIRQRASYSCASVGGSCYNGSCSTRGLNDLDGECTLTGTSCCGDAAPTPDISCTSVGGSCYNGECWTRGLEELNGTCTPLTGTSCCGGAAPEPECYQCLDGTCVAWNPEAARPSSCGDAPTITPTGGGGSSSSSSSSGGGGSSSGGGGSSSGGGTACGETRIYTLQSGSWVITPLGNIGQYAGVGDNVRLAVRGNNSQFAKGRFRVNGGAWTTTTSKNSAGEFYIEYSLSQTGKYTIEGQVQ